MTGQEPKGSDTLAGLLAEAATKTRASLAGPWIPPGIGPRRFWLWAMALGVSWHALWFVWLVPQRPLRRGYPAAPAVRLAFLAAPAGPESGQAADLDMRRVWSPVLFALPSPLGFSKDVLRQQVARRPPLEAPGVKSMFLPRASAEPPRLLSAQAPLRERAREAAATLPLRAQAPSVFPPLSESGEGFPLEVWFMPDTGGTSRVDLAVPALGEELGQRAWEAVVRLDLVAEGAAKRVLLETPSPDPAWNEQLVLQLHRQDLRGVLDAARGRLRIASPGAASAAVLEGPGRD